MNRKLEVEAVLERSLRRQVVSPRLDRRFDAGVWARIDAEQARAAIPVAKLVASSASSRWIFVSNTIGIGVAALLVIVFGTQLLAGVEVHVSTPKISAADAESLMKFVAPAITAAALLFGLMFTPIGRRLRAEIF